MSLAGIAGVSAADVGTAQTQTGNHHIVKEITKVHVKHLKYVKKQTKTHKKVFKKLKRVKKTASSKKVTTQKANKSKSKQVTTKKYKYKKWYKYHGKWKYKTVYKYKKSSSKYHKVAASSANTAKSTPRLVKSVNKYSNEKVAAGSKKRVKKYKRSASTSSINALARSLSKGTRSQYQKGSKIFNWVKKNLSYKFYYNTRYGAAGALKYRKGNCADTAHLVVALSRSSGLQAKYAHGKVRFPSGKVYGHVWALIKVNGKWYTADASSDRNSFGHMKGKVVRLKGVYNKLPF